MVPTSALFLPTTCCKCVAGPPYLLGSKAMWCCEVFASCDAATTPRGAALLSRLRTCFLTPLQADSAVVSNDLTAGESKGPLRDEAGAAAPDCGEGGRGYLQAKAQSLLFVTADDHCCSGTRAAGASSRLMRSRCPFACGEKLRRNQRHPASVDLCFQRNPSHSWVGSGTKRSLTGF